jgi:rhodanese-related sulfurtransferase
MFRKATVLTLLVFLALGFRLALADTLEVPRISKEELKALLGKPDVMIIDVRTLWDRKMSLKQIKGAIREDPTKVKSWAKKYSKEKTLIFYCA